MVPRSAAWAPGVLIDFNSGCSAVLVAEDAAPGAVFRGLLEAVGVVDHEEPSAVWLPARDLGALSFHPHGLTVCADAFEHPLRRREGEIAALGELLHIELDPGLHGEKAAQRLADGPGAGGHLPGLRDETGPGFVELDHGLDVACVDRLGE